ALLKKQNKVFKAQIIGEAKDPSILKELVDLAQKLGLSEEVTFLGHQDNIPAFLKQMNLLVLPTTYPEAFGRVIIEAQAIGVPVVATRVGGIQEVIDDGQTGILCAPKNPSDLAAAMMKVLNTPTLAQTLVQKARKKVETYYSKEQMVKKTEHLYLEMTQPHILVTKLTSLGDVILISASLRALKQKFPNSNITLLTDLACREVIEPCPYIDTILYTSKKNLRQSFWKLIQQLKHQNFDVSIDFQNTFWTHLLVFLAKIPHRYGYGRKYGWLFLNHIAQNYPLSPVEHQFEILKLLEMTPNNSKLEFWVTEEDRKSLLQKSQLEKLDIHQPFSIIHLGASWSTKQWKASHIAQFCTHLYKKANKENLNIVLTGLEKDLEFEKEIRKQTPIPLFSLVGKTTLRELGALIEKCQSFVSPDSAPLHIAAALGKPTLALFGPTESQKHRPPNDKLLILQEKIDCGPCYKPTCSHHSCMVRLTPSRAIEAYEKLQRH
ncbi:MAG: lipopolysaccharide heptosyltransferase II, partial [Deltaproteobacteria bacterium]|nr:lipopolysaccharide heptosyltransferase II [Deltaproteobacteria bacterium]